MSYGAYNNRADQFTYDVAGDLLQDGSNSYTYDAEGRISAVNGGTKYIYDAEGYRVAKEDSSGGVIASYVLGLGGEQVAEMNGSGQWQHSNVYAMGRLLATYDSAGTHFHLADALGSRRVQAQPNGTAEYWCINYPFGDGLNCWGDADATEQHFTGKERDSESGNDYFGARYYASSMGRFMSPDPLPWIAWQHGNEDDKKKFAAYIANPQDFNMYAYVLNNPLNKTDPTGMNACGTKNDSSCTVTVTLQDRTKDANGHYNDQFSNQKGNGAYNATATVTVSDHGKVIGTGKFLASTVPSGPGYATIQNGTYTGTLGSHDGHPAILLNGGGAVPVVGGVDPATGKSYATAIFVHIAGLPTTANSMGGTGMTRNGMPISAGCQLICSTQYGAFEHVTGLNASPPQNTFTVTVDTSENQ